jgi:serine/threonine protein kinase/Tol biopolymer transport system component
MATDRWRTIERLYHAALERPAEERAAFLAEACKDETLRREVLALLEQPSMPEFLGGPAIAIAAAMVDEVHVSQWIGRRIGVYHLQTLLGKGGMGEVYRARDTRLGRDVAIKVLPRAFTADPDRLARFEREARVLASLNHPHIGTIHGLEESEGVRALVLELVEGETLADRLLRGAVALPDALAIARQIADALEAAHDKGIVHRDLKPSNIKITPDGVVKVLDFGLAKGGTEVGGYDLTQSPTISIGNTHDGVILGTAPYMSPEQARGQVVDKRTDIWAFGCVLLEMLTGRVVFRGDTVSDTIATILQREPDWAALPAATPRSIDRLLRRCLEKESKRRLRDIGEARIEIDETISRPAPPEAPATQQRDRPSRWRVLTFVALAAAVVAGLAFGFWPRSVPESGWTNPLENATFTRFTDFPGTEALPDISPDGKFVVFLSDRAGEYDIWLSQVGTGTFRNLTEDMPSLPPGVFTVRSVGFSGDGSEIWFRLGATRMRAMPLIAGTPRLFLGERAIQPAWTKDGTRMVYQNQTDGDPMFVANSTGADSRRIFVDQPGLHNHNSVWSPDGQWIYFVHGEGGSGEMDAWRIRSSGGTPERLTRNATVTFLAPLDSRTLLFVARAEDRSGPWLWALDVESKISRRASSGLEQYTSVAASADGRRLVATVANPSASLWTLPLLDRVAEDADVKPYPLPTVRALSPRFDTKGSLFYLSARGGTGDGLWRFRDGQASEIWKGSDGALDETPAVSPDGRSVAVLLSRDGKRHLTVMSADGADAHALAPSIDVQGAADWSADSQSIVIGGRDGQGPGLFKVPIDGGPPSRLVSGVATSPAWSPDDTLIVYSGPVINAKAQVLAVRPDGSPVAIPEIYGGSDRQRYRFMPDGKRLVYLPVGTDDFWILDLASKQTRQIARLTPRADKHAFDITPDGKQIVFDRVSETSDIALIDIPQR